ncbi:LysE family translocator [Bradyrhizobium sp. 14AA]
MVKIHLICRLEPNRACHVRRWLDSIWHLSRRLVPGTPAHAGKRLCDQVLRSAFDVLRAAGATYLAYLAYKNFRFFFSSSRPRLNTVYVKDSNVILQGFVTNITNPKVILLLLCLHSSVQRG